MTGEDNLHKLLSMMQPKLQAEEYIFYSAPGKYGDHADLSPIASFCEEEGLTLVVPLAAARAGGLAFTSTFKLITLTVHSSLEAVGLTGAVSGRLAQKGISANIFAAFYHDHIFVQTEKAEAALQALQELGNEFK